MRRLSLRGTESSDKSRRIGVRRCPILAPSPSPETRLDRAAPISPAVGNLNVTPMGAFGFARRRPAAATKSLDEASASRRIDCRCRKMSAVEKGFEGVGKGQVPTAGETGPRYGRPVRGVACRQPNHHSLPVSTGASRNRIQRCRARRVRAGCRRSPSLAAPSGALHQTARSRPRSTA